MIAMNTLFRWSSILMISGIVSIPLLAPSSWASETNPATLPLLDQNSIRYLGSFDAPVEDGAGHPLTYGGYALSYDPLLQGLFIGCHDQDQLLGEITIPTITNPPQMAAIMQNCADVTEGRLPLIDDFLPRLGGTLSYNGRLIISGYGYYDADFSQTLSHFSSTPTLSQTGDIAGPFQVGTGLAGMVAGYMTTIPEEWRQAFNGPALTGQCCLPVIGRSSAGPAASVFDPNQVGRVTPVPSTTVLAYPIEHPLATPDGQNNLFNHTTHIMGIAFPHGTRSVLFIGRHGTGPYCYESAEICGDPVDPYKGPHAYPYIHQVWAYDANDLLAVRNGARQSWEIQPYATWQLPEMDNTGSASIMGATYDPASGRLFITEIYDTPTIHVYQIDPRYILSYTAGNHGTIRGMTQQTVTLGASGTEVTAVPDSGCHFVKWSDGVATASRTDTNVTTDITASAGFSCKTFPWLFLIPIFGNGSEQ